VDVGGGLGVDYDGSRSTSASSVNYSVQEYANDVLYTIVDAANKHELPHPNVIAESGRALVLNRVLHDQEAQIESLPSLIPGMMRGALGPVARSGVEFLSRKYHASDETLHSHMQRYREQLNALRDALKQSSPYLAGRFSYADIAMAVALQFVVPVDEKYIRLGPATRRTMTDPVLKNEYTDLIQWRDLIYGKHRRR